MPQLGSRFDFAMKSFESIGRLNNTRRHHFQSDEPLQSLVFRLEHDSHSALPQFVKNHVIAENKRLPPAAVNLLCLIFGELLLTDQLTSKLFAILRLLLGRK